MTRKNVSQSSLVQLGLILGSLSCALVAGGGCSMQGKTDKPQGTFVAMWCGPNLTFKQGEWIQWDPESPADVLYFVNRCVQGGIKRIHPSVGGLYASKIYPTKYKDWDPLKVLVAAAHDKGIEVHPYVAVFHNGVCFSNLPHRDQYMSRSRDGTKDPHFLSPGYDAVRKRMVDVYMELLEDYGVDGVMLDYIRFHKADRGYDPPIMDAFKARYGLDPRSVADDDPRWVQTRADFVTRFVRELRAAMASKNIRKPISVSAICTGDGTLKETLYFVYQDLATWAREGLVQWFCPMAYTKDLALLKKQITNFVRDIKSCNPEAKVYGAVAPYQDRLCTPQLLKAGAKVVMQSGADGICIYRGSSMEKYNLWDACRQISRTCLRQ